MGRKRRNNECPENSEKTSQCLKRLYNATNLPATPNKPVRTGEGQKRQEGIFLILLTIAHISPIPQRTPKCGEVNYLRLSQLVRS